MSEKIYIVYSMVLVLCFSSCQNIVRVEGTGDVLAKVGDHTLYASELPPLVSEHSSAVDSSALINGYIEQWVRKYVMVSEAEKELSSTLDIETLVQDYRSSLLISSFTEQYVSDNLDTTINREQLEAEFEVIGSNFLAAEAVYKVKLAKVDAKESGMEKFYKNWMRNESAKVEDYCEKYAELCNLEETWMTLDELHQKLPEKKFPKSKLDKSKDIQLYAGGFEYFVKISDKSDVGDPAPLSYIEDKLKEIIIHKRKRELVEKLESDIYTKAMTTNKIKVFKK